MLFSHFFSESWYVNWKATCARVAFLFSSVFKGFGSRWLYNHWLVG